MITGAEISHYKSIVDANLTFRDRNVLVGPNASGKSNILDALYFLHDCASDDIDTAITKRHGIDSIRQWSRTRPFNIVLTLRFKNSEGYGNYKMVVSSNKGSYRILEEDGSWFGVHPRDRYKRDQRERGHSRFTRAADGRISFNTTFTDLQPDRPLRVSVEELFLTILTGRLAAPTPYNIFRPIGDELGSFSKYQIYPNTLRNPQLVSREQTLLEDGSNLSSVLKKINSDRRFSRNKEDIVSSIRQLMPNVSDFQVRSAGGFYVPVLRVGELKNDAHDFNLSQISDGTLRTLGLLAALYQPYAPRKIALEEPEQMIHPGALPVLAEAINEFVSPARAGQERQIFITTHSPTLLDLFEPETFIWTRFRGGVTESGPVKKRQLDIIKEQLFSAGELLLTEGYF